MQTPACVKGNGCVGNVCVRVHIPHTRSAPNTICRFLTDIFCLQGKSLFHKRGGACTDATQMHLLTNTNTPHWRAGESEKGLVWGVHAWGGGQLGTCSASQTFGPHRESFVCSLKSLLLYSSSEVGTRHVNKTMTHKRNLQLRLPRWDNCCNHRCLPGPVSFKSLCLRGPFSPPRQGGGVSHRQSVPRQMNICFTLWQSGSSIHWRKMERKYVPSLKGTAGIILPFELRFYL